MSEIRFERVKRGYSIEQVNSYVTMLNEHYKELERKTEEYKGVLESLENQSAQKKNEHLKIQKRVDDYKNRLESLAKELQGREKEVVELKERNERRNKEIYKINDKISKLEEEQTELDKIPQDPSDRVDEGEITKLEEVLAEEQRKSSELLNEKSIQENMIEELSHQAEMMEAQAEQEPEEDTQDGFEKLQFIFVKARQEANLYVDEMKQKTLQEIDSINQESDRIIQEAKETAEEIREEVRRKRLKVVEAEKESIGTEAEKFWKEKNDFMEKCALIRQEAEQEKEKAVKAAEQITEETQRSLDAAEEKEKVVIERVIQMVNDKKTQIAKEFSLVEAELRDTMEEIGGIMTALQ